MAQADMLRVATFNLKHGALAEGYLGKPDQVKMACTEFRDVDILALQEVDKGVVRSKRKDLAALAAKASGMKVVFAPTMSFHVGSYGNALLVRGEIEDVEVLELGGGPRYRLQLGSHTLPPIGYEPRNAILATAHVGNRQISLAATHLSTDRQTGGRQLTNILTALALRPEPRVLLGDLNQNRRQVLAQTHIESSELADGPPTFSAAKPQTRIDHIAVKGLAICAVETMRLPISDHLALFADVE